MKLKNKKITTYLLLISFIAKTLPYNALANYDSLEQNNKAISLQEYKKSKNNNKNKIIQKDAHLNDDLYEEASRYISHNGYGVASYTYYDPDSIFGTGKENMYVSITKDIKNEGYIAGGYFTLGNTEYTTYLNAYSKNMELTRKEYIQNFQIQEILSNESDGYLVLGNTEDSISYGYHFTTAISYDSSLNKKNQISFVDLGITKANGAIYYDGYYYIVGTFSSNDLCDLTSKGDNDIILLKLDDNLNVINKISMGSTASDESYLISINENKGLRVLGSNGTTLVLYDIDKSLSVTEKVSSISIPSFDEISKVENEYCFSNFRGEITVIDENLNNINTYKIDADFIIEKIIKKNENYYLIGRDYDDFSKYSILKTDNKFNIIKSHTLIKNINFYSETEYYNVMIDDDNIVVVGNSRDTYIHGVQDGIDSTASIIVVYNDDLEVQGETPTLLGYTSGDGSSDNPYIINNLEEFLLFKRQCELRITGDAHFKLNTDIDLIDFDTDNDKSNGNWTPIPMFAGTFDGTRHTISNITVNEPDKDEIGLFATIEFGTIKNLKIKNIDLVGCANVGSVAGYVDLGGDLINITVENGKLSSPGDGSIGGIVGGVYTELDYQYEPTEKKSTIKDCKFNGIISGNSQVGSIIGYSYDADIINCKGSGEIVYIPYNYGWDSDIGGIIGVFTDGKRDTTTIMKNCSFNGTIKAEDADNVGGIAGSISSKNIEECSVNGTIIGNDYVGGAFGEVISPNGEHIQKISVNADIKGNNYVGGFIGKIYSNYSWYIQNNYTVSNIEAVTNGSGFIANLKEAQSDTIKVIQDNYTASTVKSNNSYEPFIKYSTSTDSIDMKNNYYDIDLNNKSVNTQLQDKVIALNTSKMQGKEAKSNMNFDFEKTWRLNENYYPTLIPSNTAPTITPNDKVVDSTITINQYDKFNPLDYVIVEDFEDDEVTTIIKEDIDTAKYGLFSITYVATDDKGLSSELTLSLKINPIQITINKSPVIEAEDIILTVGDKFNPYEGVIATDEEDGIITDSIKITNSTVDINKDGIYSIIYEVTDKNGATVTKTISVTVKEKVLIPNESPSKDNNNATDNNKDDTTATEDEKDNTIVKPQTRDIIFIEITTAFVSLFGLYIINKKKEK